MIHPDTYKGWRDAALSENYSLLIHPTGADPDTYEHVGKQYADMIMSHVKPKDVVMDYGCGNGRILRHIRDPKVGIDIIPEAAAMVGGFIPDNFKGKVDVIYTVNVLIHNSYENGCKIIKWMHGKLKKGGLLLLHMPVYEVAKEPDSYIDVGVWTYDMLNDAVEGFKIVHAMINPGEFSFEKIGPYHTEFHILIKI